MIVGPPAPNNRAEELFRISTAAPSALTVTQTRNEKSQLREHVTHATGTARMRLTRSSLVRSFVTLAVSGCIGGTGSGLVGINGGGNGGGNTARVLVFNVQPSNADSGNFITPAIQVAALDSTNAVDASFNGSVTVTLGANSTGASLSGTRTTTALAGVATFGDLSVNRVGSYTLVVSGGGASATSSGFTISPPAGALRAAP